jgi:hypothetical protein
MERRLSPGVVFGNSGELISQSGGDDTTGKRACTDAAVFVDYSLHYINFAPLSALKTNINYELEQ